MHYCLPIDHLIIRCLSKSTMVASSKKRRHTKTQEQRHKNVTNKSRASPIMSQWLTFFICPTITKILFWIHISPRYQCCQLLDS